LAHHRLHSNSQTVNWGFWDASVSPTLTIRSGDMVTIDTLSGEHDDLPIGDHRYTILNDHSQVVEGKTGGPGPHLLTGPIYVEDAEPGDILEVTINKISLRQDWGWNLQLPLHGGLPEDFPDTRRIHVPIDLKSETVTLPWGQSFKCRPFFGCMGVAPPLHHGRLSTVEPREFGGNMDNKELREGAVIQFPVFVPGALFSVGDGHALQGDGEACLTAIETSLTGAFTFRLLKQEALSRPRAVTATELITMAFHEDLDDAAKIALRDMVFLLSSITGLGPQDAYTLCSIAADLRVTQIVDRNKGVHCAIKKDDLPGKGKELQPLFDSN